MSDWTLYLPLQCIYNITYLTVIEVCTHFSVQYISFKVIAKKVNCVFYSCNMGTSGLPDTPVCMPKAQGLQAYSVHIKQITSAHDTTIM